MKTFAHFILIITIQGQENKNKLKVKKKGCDNSEELSKNSKMIKNFKEKNKKQNRKQRRAKE